MKMWIAYLIPRIEDGNNFGVSIQVTSSDATEDGMLISRMSSGGHAGGGTNGGGGGGLLPRPTFPLPPPEGTVRSPLSPRSK